MKKYFFLSFFWVIGCVNALESSERGFSISSHSLYQHLDAQYSLAPNQLNLGGSPLHLDDTIILSTFIQGRNTLTYVDLSACDLNDKASELIVASLMQHPNLIYLNLSLNALGERAAQALELLTLKVRAIRHLDLRINYFPGMSLVPLLKNLKEHNKITYLDLSFNSFTGKSVDGICDLVQGCSSLKRLYLSCIGLSGTKRTNILSAFGQSSSLSELSLAYNSFAQQGKEIGQMINTCKTLTILNLSHCDLSCPDFCRLFDQINSSMPQQLNSILFPFSQPKTRLVQVKLEDTPTTRFIKRYYEQRKPEAPRIDLHFLLGSP